jgi:polyisoprenoid-binding protein YceI
MSVYTWNHKCAVSAAAAMFTLATASAALAQNTSGADAAMPIEVRGGTASFDVGTNVPALSVHGKSNALEARGRVRPTANGPQLEHLEATVPVNTLATGMGMRDSHMRKYVFTTSDGQTPDVKFVAKTSTCQKSGNNQSTCQVAGDLSIRGTARPFSIAMKVIESGDSYRASGEGIVKLSTYGIPQPSQLGVHTDDDVKLRLEVTARPAPVATTGIRSAGKSGDKR